jgi:hypothetical protein
MRESQWNKNTHIMLSENQWLLAVKEIGRTAHVIVLRESHWKKKSTCHHAVRESMAPCTEGNWNKKSKCHHVA